MLCGVRLSLNAMRGCFYAILSNLFLPSQVLPTATLQTLVLNTNSLGDAGAEQVAKAVAGGWGGTPGAWLGRGGP